MARIDITLDQDEVLRLLREDATDAFRALVQDALNAILLAESQEQLGAAPYERTPGRKDSRNGTRQRQLVTRIGTIDLDVPRHRNAPFKTLVFDNYKRSEAALVTTMAEMVVTGTSTAKVGRVMETICGRSFSKQAVSEACKELDEAVSAFRGRPLEQDYPFVMADATYLKARQDHRSVSKALLVAVGFTRGGLKEVTGFSVADSETRESWTAFFESLRARGLSGVRMLTSDAHDGLVGAFQEVFPGAAWQRCQAHFSRNVCEAAPKGYKAGLKTELGEMFNAGDVKLARKLRDEILADYAEVAPKAMETLDAGFDDAMTVMELPENMRRPLRTSNYVERLNAEVKRRSKAIGVFPNADSVRRLMGAVLMEEDGKWATMKKMYFQCDVDTVEKRHARLTEIARIQKELRKAA